MILPIGLVLSACAATVEAPQRKAETTSLSITALYRERIMLAPGHSLQVRIEDVSLADAPAVILVETTQSLTAGPPYTVALDVATRLVNPQRTYAARAEIRDPQGKLVFTTDTRYPVLTQG
ncbi:hypothetical protein LTR94_027478, partial [Friedmanniomyces endolithicus]